MLRILEFITPSRIGGAEVQLLRLVRELISLGDQPTVLCPEGRPLVDYLAKEGIKPVTWRTRGKIDPLTLIRLKKLLRTGEFNLVHTHLSTASFIGCLAAKLAGLPCIATVHGLNTAVWYRFADRIVAVSNAVKEHLVKQGLPAEKVEVLYHGVSLARYIPREINLAKMDCGFNPAVKRVGVLGRLAPEKGQEAILRTWPSIRRSFPEARLMLIGEGRDMERLRQLAGDLELGRSVEFCGFQVDPGNLISACDVVAAPSIREGLSLAVLEAMALARPVVCTDAGGLIEVVVHNETGLIVPVNDAAALETALVKLLRDEDLCFRMGTAGRRRIEERFDADKQIAKLRGLMVEMCADSGSRFGSVKAGAKKILH